MQELATLGIITTIVSIAFGILTIILFFKVWGMTNDVVDIKNLLSLMVTKKEDSYPSIPKALDCSDVNDDKEQNKPSKEDTPINNTKEDATDELISDDTENVILGEVLSGNISGAINILETRGLTHDQALSYIETLKKELN